MENNKIKSITIAENESYLRQISISFDIVNDGNLSSDIDVLEQFCK